VTTPTDKLFSTFSRRALSAFNDIRSPHSWLFVENQLRCFSRFFQACIANAFAAVLAASVAGHRPAHKSRKIDDGGPRYWVGLKFDADVYSMLV